MTALHPLFDAAGIDQRLIDAITNDEPIVVTHQFKRYSELCGPGEIIPDFGTLARDDHPARMGWVITKAAYDAQAAENKRRKWDRDVLSPAQAAAGHADFAVTQAAAKVASLKAQLKAAQADLDAANEQAQAAHAALEETLKQQPDLV